MRIAVLDGYAMNPGDLTWDALQALGDCTIHDRTGPDQVLTRTAGREIVLTNKVHLTRSHFEELPGLRYIGVLATGTNIVDLKAAEERGIVVTNVPDYSTASVAQLTIALLLELTSRVGAHSDGVRSGKWSRCADFSYADYPLVELDGLTLGIVGYGRIGQKVASIARALGMRVLVHTRTPPRLCLDDVSFVDLEAVFQEADVISLHCPLTTETHGLVNTDRLALMKSSAFLINTARGPLIVEASLARSLNDGAIAGAAVDVLATEPPSASNPLLTGRNCIITPHIGWATAAARRRLMETAVANVKAFLAGRPHNVVRSS